MTRTFKIAASGTLEITNKYGSVFIDTWDKDSVKINLEFIISEKNENRFKKTKSSVSFDFSGNSFYRSAKTLYGNNYSSLFKDLKEATNLLSSNEEQTHVNYYVTIPDYINLKIDNKYGNIILPSLNGDINIKLANGDLQARELNGNSNLQLSFGSTIIKKVEQGNLSLNFMETSIENTSNITLESKSSDVAINKCNLLKLDARRGKIIIEECNYIFGDSEFCELYFNKLKKEIGLNIKYGVLKNILCSDSYEKVSIKSTSADINIKIPDSKAFNITTYDSKATLNFAKDIKWKDPVIDDTKEMQKRTGDYKTGSTRSNIIIEISNAELNFE
ncbi:hypothetical protein [Plebeiibacterium marinum]|uniref:Adhesin domain-containing protein n=1 Tax=Plebeiibacterium marinum TaxID=2992111 RepID=A0AAE3MC15_9BACT|nr:hypothetical protein [Plebeiobacterium marinum]MCW3804966.1 hypothetical protein [Plebeiobacterium marinum]